MEPCTIQELKQMEFNADTHPRAFYDGALEIEVKDWTDLSVYFVQWLVNNKYLTTGKLPILNHAKRGKYFINSQPCHQHLEKDGVWKQFGSFYIDTKYNARDHISNILSALEQLNVPNPHISIAFR